MVPAIEPDDAAERQNASGDPLTDRKFTLQLIDAIANHFGPQMIFAAYGHFMLVWAEFEAVIELGIMKQTGMDPIISQVVTSGLAFERRASILRSLLHIRSDPDDPNDVAAKKAISLINSIAQEADRNHLIHGVPIGLQDKGGVRLGFVKRTTDQQFKGKWKEMDAKSFTTLNISIDKKTNELREFLGITDEDQRFFSNIGRILSNKSFRSPQPPPSKDAE